MKEHSILNVEVSRFEDYFHPMNPVNVNLLTWLKSSEYQKQVEKIRQTDDEDARDKLKAKLPAITSGGIFSQRNSEYLTRFSGFMQLDLDLKHNKHLPDFDQLKSFISVLPYVAYCGLSASGKSFWVLVPIPSLEHYKRYFEAISQDWKDSTGIIVDPARKDYAGLRGYSWDEDAYFNHQATSYSKKSRQAESGENGRESSTNGKYEDVFEFAISRIKEQGLTFAEGNRHQFIFKISCILNTYGVPEQETRHWIHSNLIPESEIKSNCITGPYRRYKSDFGKKIFTKTNHRI